MAPVREEFTLSIRAPGFSQATIQVHSLQDNSVLVTLAPAATSQSSTATEMNARQIKEIFTTRCSPGAGSAKLGSAFAMPFTLGANYHFLKRGSRVDVYLGPSIGWVLWGDLRLEDDQTASTESDVAIGGQVGVGVKLSEKSRWTFEATVQYLQTQFGDETLKIDVDPMMLRVGFGRRY